MRRKPRKSYRNMVADDIEIMPLMNLFVAMIPMLLISAVFLNVTVIDMKSSPDARDASVSKNKILKLAVTIKDDYFVIEGDRVKTYAIARADGDAEVQLATALTDIATSSPSDRNMMIISQPDTRYADIIAVMDISREAGLPPASLLAAN